VRRHGDSLKECERIGSHVISQLRPGLVYAPIHFGGEGSHVVVI
jgi:hypothetical protein